MRRPIALLAILAAVLTVAAGCSRARSDDAIATDIKARMFSDAQLKDNSLEVAVKGAEVTLSGGVPSETARYEAFKLASDTPGVKKVNDQMTVQTAQAAPPAPATPALQPSEKPKPDHRARQAKRKEAPSTEPQPVRATGPAQVLASAPAPTAAASAAPAPPPPPRPRTVEIPVGTTVSVRMIDSIDSAVNHTGELFRASLETPLVAGSEVVVPRGTDVYVRLIEARSAGHLSGRSELKLELVRLEFHGKPYSLVSSTYDSVGTSRGKRTAATVGGAAAVGAAIGAIAGGGKGAAIGAGTGAASGGVYQGVTKGKQVKIPSETKLDFRLEQPLSITYTPGGQK